MAFERLRSLINIRSEPKKKKNSDGAMVVSLNDLDKWCSSGYTKLENNADVQACISTIADLISSMTIMLMENTNRGDVRVRNGLSRKIDVTPYRFGTRKTLIYKVVKELLLTGNSVLLPRTKDGLLEELFPISDGEYVFSPFDNGYSVRYKKQVFDHDEVVHFVNNPDMDNPWRGNPYKIYLKDVIENLDTTQRVKKRFYTKDYKPNVIFGFNSDSDDFQSLDGRDKLLKKWIETKEGEPYIVPTGLVEFKTIPSMSISDLAINDSVTLDKKVIAAIFGVPPFLLGIGTYNEREWNNFVNKTIVPICREIEQELTRKLIYSEQWYFSFNLKSIMAFDFVGRNELLMSARTMGAVNGNEIRLSLGLQPIDDPVMDEYSMLENYIPNAAIGTQKKLNQITKQLEGDQ